MAVEEQFYLVWPWLVLFLNRRALVPVTVLLIIAGPVARAWGVWHGWNEVSLRTFPLDSLDALGLGALLAIGWREFPNRMPRLRIAALVVGIAVLLLATISRMIHVAQVGAILAQSGFAMIFCWLVGAAAIGFRGVVGTILTLRPLLLIGWVSYGIYVYHPFALRVPGMLHLPQSHHAANLLLAMALAIALPLASWFLYEKPINALKKYFPYGVRTGDSAV